MKRHDGRSSDRAEERRSIGGNSTYVGTKRCYRISYRVGEVIADSVHGLGPDGHVGRRLRDEQGDESEGKKGRVHLRDVVWKGSKRGGKEKGRRKVKGCERGRSRKGGEVSRLLAVKARGESKRTGSRRSLKKERERNEDTSKR